jgi:Domain of unknown function (DUF4351)
MPDYDSALKAVLQHPATVTLRELTGGAVEKWLNVELQRVQGLRVDLLGETSGGLVHLELQSTNDSTMAARMAEYCFSIYKQHGRLPRQVLLYVGEPALRMVCEIRGEDVLFRYRAVDVRELDGERLLESSAIGDNVIAILARLRDHKVAVQRIIRRIAGLDAGERVAALDWLFTLAGLRRLDDLVDREVRQMPILDEIREDSVIGRARKAGIEEGLQRGELILLRRQIEKRFGAVPKWAEDRLAAKSAADLEELGLRLLDAPSLDDLLK